MKVKIVYHNSGLRTFSIDGKEVTQEEYEAATASHFEEVLTTRRTPRGHSPSCWPMKSDAEAVHPRQIEAAMARDKRHGVTGVTYDPEDGRAIFADQGAKRDMMRLKRVHDNNGSYGEDTGGSTVTPMDYLPEEPMVDIPVREGTCIGETVRRINK